VLKIVMFVVYSVSSARCEAVWRRDASGDQRRTTPDAWSSSWPRALIPTTRRDQSVSIVCTTGVQCDTSE